MDGMSDQDLVFYQLSDILFDCIKAISIFQVTGSDTANPGAILGDWLGWFDVRVEQDVSVKVDDADASEGTD